MKIYVTAFSRARDAAVARWYLFLPAALFALELTLHRWHPLLPLYLSASFASQPWLSVAALAGTTLKAWLCYSAMALALDGLLQPICRRNHTRALVFLSAYGLWLGWLLAQRPNVAALGGARLAVGFLMLTAAFAFAGRSDDSAPTRRSFSAGACLVLVLLLAFTRTPNWKRGAETPAKASAGAPSFLLLGFDGVSGDAVPSETLTPLWKKKWSGRGIEFTNAYSVTNSTFTSWYSILSGRYPSRTGKRTLFPFDRKGDTGTLITEKLRRAGYRTVFLTDCSNTSFAEPSLGFDDWFQPGIGFLDCADAYFTAVHPLTYALSPLFPRLDSFCSPVYGPDRFFSEVERTLAELSRRPEPFLMAVHSCATQHAFAHPPPKPWTAPAVPGTPPELGAALHWMDGIVDKTLSQAASTPKPVWTAVLSDHGVHAGKHGALTHGVGLPVDRGQYHVPLLLVPPRGAAAPTRVDTLVSVMDLAPSLLRLAGAPPDADQDGRDLAHPEPGRELLLVSALDPMPATKEASFWKMDRAGVMAFTEPYEEYLAENAAAALVRLPYRLLKSASGKHRLYDEMSDPSNERDLSAQFPALVAELDGRLRKLSSRPAPKRVAHQGN